MPTRPATFLLTDIEGSTTLWERDASAMSRAVGRHDALLAEAVTRHGGVVVKSRGEGDSLFTVFDDPAAAVRAAVDGQLALAAESWVTADPIAVRMALHTGDAELRDGDYYGPVVNRCARLRGIARGGQVLTTGAVAAAIGERLDEGVTLGDLGSVRLRGFADTEPIFAVGHPGLQELPGPRAATQAEFRVLGALEVEVGGRLVALGRGKQSALLALLLLRPGEVVLSDRLIDDLWGDHPPDSAAAALQVYVSRIRKLLPADTLVTEGGGYRLAIDADDVDAHRFRKLVDEGQLALAGGDAETAASLLAEGLALWRGPAFADVAYEPFAQPDIARLEELRMAAVEERIEADLARGRGGELVGELEALIAEHPLRERLRGQLMLALYRSGRQADALAAYHRAREALVEALGIEPGPELRELERRVLSQDPDLLPAVTAVPRVRAADAAPPVHAMRVLLVDDQVLLRGALRAILESEPDITVVGEAGDGADAVELVAEIDPDLVLMDLRMPVMDGLEATRRMLSAPPPHPRVVILTTFDLDEYVYEAVRAGASGFMLKSAAPEQIVDGLRAVARGDALLAPEITRRLLEAFVQRPPVGAATPLTLAELTEDERDVLRLMAGGLSNSEIAQERSVEESVVEGRVNALLATLGVRDRVQAVVVAYESGLVGART